MTGPNGDLRVRVAAICGSLREVSYTRMALNAALQGAVDLGADVHLIDLRDYDLVLCRGKDDEYNYPDTVRGMREEARRAHGIILGTPEYHGGYSGVLKNALDLMGFSEFEGKMIGLVGVSGGALGGVNALNHLRDVGRSLRSWVVPTQAAVPHAWEVFDEHGICGDESMARRLKAVGAEAARFAYLHSSAQAKQFLTQWENAQTNPGAE